jgi:hypothetical protein
VTVERDEQRDAHADHDAAATCIAHATVKKNVNGRQINNL